MNSKFTMIVRILLGAILMVFGSNKFLHFIPMPPPLLRRDITNPEHPEYIPDRPKIFLPGSEWVLSQQSEELGVPSERCTCGIYLVTDPAQAMEYLNTAGVIARVAGWGGTIPAAYGARVEKAYPQELYAVGITDGPGRTSISRSRSMQARTRR